MTKSILETSLDSVGPHATRICRTILDLEIHLSNSSHFRSYIYDHREVQCLADRLGLSPEQIRSELKRLGYKLINNGHGRKVWKNKEGERMIYAKKIASLEEYLSKCETRQLQFYDKSEIGRIAKRIGVDRASVRAALRRRGYRLSLNAHSIAVWIRRKDCDPRSLIAGAFVGSVLSLGAAYYSGIYNSYQFYFS